jgi:hypothetical protein
MNNGKSTTIEISIETYNKIHEVGRILEKIVHKKHHLSFDQILKVMLTVEPLDIILEKLMTEKF